MNDLATRHQMHPVVWAIAFTAAMAVTGFAERYWGIGRTGAIAGMAAASLFLIPMIRAAQHRADAQGISSPALRIYNRRFTVWTFAYMVALTIGITIHQKMDATGPLMWAAGLLTALPVLGMIWTMVRYLREEEDEYLRLRAANSGLIATAILLAIATAWGFLEMFGLVPHVWTWAAFPLWAIGLAIGQLVQARQS